MESKDKCKKCWWKYHKGYDDLLCNMQSHKDANTKKLKPSKQLRCIHPTKENCPSTQMTSQLNIIRRTEDKSNSHNPNCPLKIVLKWCQVRLRSMCAKFYEFFKNEEHEEWIKRDHLWTKIPIFIDVPTFCFQNWPKWIWSVRCRPLTKI